MGQDGMSWPILYFNIMSNSDPHELANIIKLWFDDLNTSKFWEVTVEHYRSHDAVKIQHIYPSIGKHDNALLVFWISVPHDAASFTTLRFEDDAPALTGPHDPNFFEYLRRYTSKAITTLMEDMNKRLSQGLEYEGVSLCKEL